MPRVTSPYRGLRGICRAREPILPPAAALARSSHQPIEIPPGSGDTIEPLRAIAAPEKPLPVAQIFNLLYRRLGVGRMSPVAAAPQPKRCAGGSESSFCLLPSVRFFEQRVLGHLQKATKETKSQGRSGDVMDSSPRPSPRSMRGGR